MYHAHSFTFMSFQGVDTTKVFKTFFTFDILSMSFYFMPFQMIFNAKCFGTLITIKVIFKDISMFSAVLQILMTVLETTS